MDELSVYHVQADQSDLLLLVSTSTSSTLIVGNGAVHCAGVGDLKAYKNKMQGQTHKNPVNNNKQADICLQFVVGRL